MEQPDFNESLSERDDCDCCDSCDTLMMTNCLSCGMPMTKIEDFGGKNPANLYCVHCSNPDGSLKSRDEVLDGIVNFMMISQNMDRETAEGKAKEYMSKMPAWSQD